MGYNRIIPQMFDVRPVDETGGLDWKKIEQIEKISKIAKQEPKIFKKRERKYEILEFPEKSSIKKAKIYQLGIAYDADDLPIFLEDQPIQFDRVNEFSISKNKAFRKVPEAIERPKQEKIIPPAKQTSKFSDSFYENNYEDNYQKPASEIYYEQEKTDYFPGIDSRFGIKRLKSLKPLLSFAVVACFVALIIGSASLISKSLKVKEKVLGSSQEAYNNLNSAIASVKSQNFENSSLEFDKAYETFSQASEDLDSIGSLFVDVSKYVPFASKLSSGKNVVDAGKHISAAGQALNETMKIMKDLKNPLSKDENNISLLEIFKATEKNLLTAQKELKSTEECLNNVSIDDLPKDKQDQFLELKEKLPAINSALDNFLNNSNIFTDILGGNGQRKYLFLFQNNNEMRATGGFIGSYGILDINNGRIKNFMIDGIFNPDGQLKEKIIPPKPIQKISAAWSLHDSNWFPNFPTSAKKAILFFEKTGGPTVDGVITLTPTVMQKLLAITGPIEMKDYDVVLDADNFVEKTQYEVEVDYDKNENKPKKILSDLAPIILDKLFNARDIESVQKTISVLSEALNEKHILIYSENKDLQELISSQRWSGEIFPTQKDYLSIINTNINGYKTDGVVKEEITHKASIEKDGTIIDTVTITRKHEGGNSDYEWQNKVNADYMRVYVPQGSELLSVEGQTKELNDPPLDYDALEFKKDPDVQKEEEGMTIDDSATRIYDESDKTVFANWVYVSPKETTTIKYKYLLPFKADLGQEKIVNSYSLLIQKQSGSAGSQFKSIIDYPENYSIAWDSPENIEKSEKQLKFETDLETDKFIGVVFTNKDSK